jgi:anti-sigma regulatory factor (Ser/Thr protein kinase)
MMRELRLTIRKQFDSFAILDPAVAEFLEAHHVVADARYKVELALEEAITNLIRHSPHGGASDFVKVCLQIGPEDLIIRIADDGAPFDKKDVPSPEVGQPLAERAASGMGIHLIRTMVDEIHYERIGCWNQLEMRIRIPPGDSADFSASDTT